MKIKKIFQIIIVFSIIAISCSGPKNMLLFSEYEVHCVGTGSEGTELIKVFAYGKKADMSDAVAEAKRNAIHAILFRGISANSGCGGKAMADLRDLETHKEFYSNFFKPGGQYLSYVNLSTDGSISANDRLKVGNRYKIGVIISVSKASLRKDLESAGVLKKLTSGF